MPDEMTAPQKILIRGTRVHNLKNIDVDVSLNRIIGTAGVSGFGKSSLALGVLYVEGSRRYLDAPSTYTRRRMTQTAKAQVDEVLYVPASLALRQRPGVPGVRSTFGTGTKFLNSLRLMFPRLAEHRCSSGHYLKPSLAVAAVQELICPECGEHLYAPSAEELAFNSQGTCRRCDGMGTVRAVNESILVPDESLTIDKRAVAPWKTLMRPLMTDVCGTMGVRTNVPFRELIDWEKEMVYHGPMEKRYIIYKARTSNQAGELGFAYYNAVYTAKDSLARVKGEKGMKRVEKFLKEGVCPDYGGTRLSETARMPRVLGISLDEAYRMTLTEAAEWVRSLPSHMPEEMRPMAESICDSFTGVARRLMDLGFGYLTLGQATSTLSTGERQRMQLARAVRNRMARVLYVLDEPSIGLHPSNIVGLNDVMHDLIADENSVLLVDHGTQILGEVDWLIEMGPQAGADGNRAIAQGTIEGTEADGTSQIGVSPAGRAGTMLENRASSEEMFSEGAIHLSTSSIHTVKPLEVDIPKGKLTVVTGASGSGRTTVILESLIPGLEAHIAGGKLPEHVLSVRTEGISHIKLTDVSPIGINVRSTMTTYTNVHDGLRKIYRRAADAKHHGYKAGDFSYNTGMLRCPACDGTGTISLDVQFLPDIDIPCPNCRGSCCAKMTYGIRHTNKEHVSRSLPELVDMDVNHALESCKDMKTVQSRLQVLQSPGLGYLILGEETSSFSGGEAQRLKLANEVGKTQSDSVFVFDEPAIGLHPLSVQTLLGVFRTLIASGTMVIVIEHDLDVIRSADYCIDMGPGDGKDGGRIVAAGTPFEIVGNKESVTGKYL